MTAIFNDSVTQRFNGSVQLVACSTLVGEQNAYHEGKLRLVSIHKFQFDEIRRLLVYLSTASCNHAELRQTEQATPERKTSSSVNITHRTLCEW